MRRARSPVARFTALLTATFAVWCLGCSAFESVLLAWGADTAAISPVAPVGSTIAGIPAPDSAGDDDCGCHSCAAAAAPAITAVSDASATPALPTCTLATRSSDSVKPLVPPPQPAA